MFEWPRACMCVRRKILMNTGVCVCQTESLNGHGCVCVSDGKFE